MIIAIKHVENETAGSIAEFFNGVKYIELSKGDVFPKNLEDIEAVFSMGGPMNVYEEDKFPFLKEENKFLKELLEREIPYFGVCLGAQLLAKACGAKVYEAEKEEIGWHKVDLTVDGMQDRLFKGLPRRINVFQWHRDTFDIPENGILLAKGNEVTNQAFRVGSCAYGLQFHIEVTPTLLMNWFGNDTNKYINSGWHQFGKQAEEIYKNFLHVDAQKLGNYKLYRTVIDSTEKDLIEDVLNKTEGNQIQASDILGINRNTLRSKIRKLGIRVNK
jgi:GMP synthase-like glutamine amidotransferase